MIGLTIGLVIGFYGANYLNRNANAPTSVQTSNIPINPNQPARPGVQMPDVQKVLDTAKNEPQNYEAQIAAGEMYARIRRFDKALEFYQKAYEIKPGDFDANVKLGNAHFDAKQYIKAETFYAKALEIKNDPDVRTDYGLTFFLREPSEVDQAIAEYRESLKINPKHELALQNLGAALEEKGDKEGLQKVLARLKEVNPQNSLVQKLGTKE